MISKMHKITKLVLVHRAGIWNLFIALATLHIYFCHLQNTQPDHFEFNVFRRSMGFVSVYVTDINILYCHIN
jgi:hypothetical protein